MLVPDSKILPRQISIVGLGVSEYPVFSNEALQSVLQADVVIGSPRQLAMLKTLEQSERALPFQVLPALKALPALLENYIEKNIVVLASGDPLFFGIGRWFQQRYPMTVLRFFPAVSSIQVACHRLGLSLQDVCVHSLHGRLLATLATVLRPNRDLVLLTDQNSTPVNIAKFCIEKQFIDAEIIVCERLGYSDEKVRRFAANELIAQQALEFDPLHVTVLRCGVAINKAENGRFLPVFPGIEDSAYITGEAPGKGMITKREVRLVLLSLLQPTSNDLIWDVGAGCGGVSVELAYWTPTATIMAVECNEQRLHCLQQNRERFGVVNNLEIIFGEAPLALDTLQQPNKIFIGGNGGNLQSLLVYCWAALPAGGMLLVSSVAETSLAILQDFCVSHKQFLVGVTEVAVARGGAESFAEGNALSLTRKKPVTIFQWQKPV